MSWLSSPTQCLRWIGGKENALDLTMREGEMHILVFRDGSVFMCDDLGDVFRVVSADELAGELVKVLETELSYLNDAESVHRETNLL